MPISLEGQVALVTGAGRGLGRAFALDLARHGAAVLVNDIGGALDGVGSDTAVAARVAAEITAAGGTAAANYNSVADHEGAYQMVKQAIDTWGRLDIVVSNAGFLRDQAIHNMREEDWRAIIDTHLTGAYHLMHHAWPIFRQQAYGRVVLVSSNSGYIGNFGQANYGAAKAGLIGLMNVLKLEGAKYNVMVNCLGPGAATRMTESLMPEERLRAMAPELVAPAVTFLCSPACQESGYIIEASGGTFGRAAIVRNNRVSIEHATADDIAARWDEITDLGSATAYYSFQKTMDEYRQERRTATSA
jgi:NAD(P)-dependent dehydrogenase (short-subunit alcohol dehydrogenase family)